MKIILDDMREFPTNGNYNCVRTYEDCTFLLSVFKQIEFISLDYDLGSKYTGYDVLVYMKENRINPKHINIHSDHSYGIPKMKSYVEKNFPTAVITTNNMHL